MNHCKAEVDKSVASAPIDPKPADWLAGEVLALVRLMLAASAEGAGEEPRLTNEAAVDALARRLAVVAGAAGSRTPLMALRDLVWRVDTARVLIEPKLDAAGCTELAELLSTEDIHALLRDIS